MSRLVNFDTPQLGLIRIFAFWNQGGRWEKEWDTLRGTWVGSLISPITDEAFTNALHKYYKPLVDQLGLPPHGALIKLESPECFWRTSCAMYSSNDCLVRAKKRPMCFQPDVDERQLAAASEVVNHWTEGTYVVVVG